METRERDLKRAVGAEIAKMRVGGGAHGAGGNALPRELRLGVRLQFRPKLAYGGQGPRVERLEHGCGAARTQLREADAVGREHAGQRMDQHASKAERVGHEAGMLSARAAKGVQHIVGHVIAALHGDGPDRIGHVLDRDPDEAISDLFGRAAVAELARQASEGASNGVPVERLGLIGSENVG